jgi:hypothetical protein
MKMVFQSVFALEVYRHVARFAAGRLARSTATTSAALEICLGMEPGSKFGSRRDDFVAGTAPADARFLRSGFPRSRSSTDSKPRAFRKLYD